MGRNRLSIVFISIVLLATGCTNSKLIIAPLYNQLDNQMRSEFDKLGDFNDEQNAAFDAAVGTYHVWHRRSEMPQYAALLKDIAQSIAVPGRTQATEVRQWAESIETYSRTARECHPVNYLFDLMKTLTDEQIDFIEKRFMNERRKNRERYESRSPEERIEHRLKRMQKWAGRIGLEFTANQRAALQTALSQQISLREQYYTLSDQWKLDMFKLARNQDAPDYDEQMGAHLASLWSLLENAYPTQWRENRELWQRTAFEFVQSMTDEQRETTTAWIDKMGDTVLSISQDEPSFQVGTDPTVGCLVDSSS